MPGMAARASAPHVLPVELPGLEETASQAVVRYLRHSRPGLGGWMTSSDVVLDVPEAMSA